jgi:hypothetical protein
MTVSRRVSDIRASARRIGCKKLSAVRAADMDSCSFKRHNARYVTAMSPIGGLIRDWPVTYFALGATAWKPQRVARYYAAHCVIAASDRPPQVSSKKPSLTTGLFAFY